MSAIHFHGGYIPNKPPLRDFSIHSFQQLYSSWSLHRTFSFWIFYVCMLCILHRYDCLFRSQQTAFLEWFLFFCCVSPLFLACVCSVPVIEMYFVIKMNFMVSQLVLFPSKAQFRPHCCKPIFIYGVPSRIVSYSIHPCSYRICFQHIYGITRCISVICWSVYKISQSIYGECFSFSHLSTDKNELLLPEALYDRTQTGAMANIEHNGQFHLSSLVQMEMVRF